MLSVVDPGINSLAINSVLEIADKRYFWANCSSFDVEHIIFLGISL